MINYVEKDLQRRKKGKNVEKIQEHTDEVKEENEKMQKEEMNEKKSGTVFYELIKGLK